LSSAKEKHGKERNEEKEKKEVKGDPHIKGCGNQIFKSKSRSTLKRSWIEA
jgi:hypothetical protein